MKLERGQARSDNMILTARLVGGVLVGVAVAMSIASSESARVLAATCEDLVAAVRVPDTTITSVELVAAGAFKPDASVRGGRFDDLPAFCRVEAVSKPTPQSNIGIEIWLPAENWNGKFQSIGWAFWGGAINPAPLAEVLRQGYATATTDGGHQDGNVARFALGHGEGLIDWAERSWHETAVAAKAAIAAMYGRPPEFSYWNSCGGGTRQGLTQIHRYPEDYDAMAAGAVSSVSRTAFSQSWMYDVTHTDAASLIPREKLTLLNDAVVAACDANDGVVDKLISDPQTCRFDPAVLTCRQGDAANCLTARQVASARSIYAGPSNPLTNELIAGGMMPGSELGWNAASATRPPQGGFNLDFFRYFVFRDLDWDPAKRPLDYDRDFALASVPALERVGTPNPDISAFLRRGGQLLIYAGWNDTAVPPSGSTEYYEKVVEAVGRARAEQGVRLFMIPGMGHCPVNPTAANGMVFDPLPVLQAWKEKGVAPAAIQVGRRVDSADAQPVSVRAY